MINARFSYHGWQIELIEEIQGYSFRCWRSGTNEGISDRLVYSSHEQALAVARQRADLESACLALLRFLNDLAGRSYYLTRDDGDALRDSILEYARVGSLF
jgi:hypothetical protein